MAENTNEPTDTQPDNLVDMSDEQILDLINKYYDLYKRSILDFDNEADFPTEDLVDVVAGMTYLIESGAMPNLPEVFGDFWKEAWTELSARMGNIPTDNPTRPELSNVDGNEDDTLVEPKDYTDVAQGDYDPSLAENPLPFEEKPEAEAEAEAKPKPEAE